MNCSGLAERQLGVDGRLTKHMTVTPETRLHIYSPICGHNLPIMLIDTISSYVQNSMATHLKVAERFQSGTNVQFPGPTPLLKLQMCITGHVVA